MITVGATEQVLPSSDAKNSTLAVVTQPPCPLQTQLPIQSPPVVNVYPQPHTHNVQRGKFVIDPVKGLEGTPGG